MVAVPFTLRQIGASDVVRVVGSYDVPPMLMELAPVILLLVILANAQGFTVIL